MQTGFVIVILLLILILIRPSAEPDCLDAIRQNAAMKTTITNLVHSHDVIEASRRRSQSNSFNLGRDVGREEMLRELFTLTQKQTNSPP